MSSCCGVWVDRCLEMCWAREIVRRSQGLVGLKIDFEWELGRASVDGELRELRELMQAVRVNK